MFHTTSIVFGMILAAQVGADSRALRNDQVRVEHCVVSQIEHAQLPAQEAGVLSQLNVKEGDRVKEGDVLGKIDDTDALVRRKAAQFKLNVETEKATNDALVRLQAKLIELYKAEYEQSIAINNRSPGTISESELRVQRVRWEKAVLDAVVEDMNFKIAGLQQKVAEVEVEAVENELNRRTLKAPYDGDVINLMKQRSEWVREGDVVLWMVRMDRLRVEGFVNEEVSPNEVFSADVEITVDLGGQAKKRIAGTISYVSDIVESNGDYRVWAEIENPESGGDYPWLLRPGIEADMVINLKPSAAAPTR
jgi:multidrug efflux pump subunit AcrA (membrane-fusion protein)